MTLGFHAFSVHPETDESATEDLYVTDADLALLAAECTLILEHLAEVAAHTRFTEDYIDFRANNILEAIRMAEAVERGMIVIRQQAGTTDLMLDV